MNKATQAQIKRFLDIKMEIDALNYEYEELKNILITSADEYGIIDEKNPNKRTFTNGINTVSVTTVIQTVFDTKTFKTEHKALYDKYYNGIRKSERITVTTK